MGVFKINDENETLKLLGFSTNYSKKTETTSVKKTVAKKTESKKNKSNLSKEDKGDKKSKKKSK